METFIYKHPVAICTLADESLREQLSAMDELQDVLVAPLYTENLGIEQIIEFSLTQPRLRFIILCGQDARQTIGHLPGQSLVSLAKNGVDDSGRIIGAQGKRPVICNLSASALDYFRANVRIVDLIEEQDPRKVLAAFEACVQDDPGPAPAYEGDVTEIPHIEAAEPQALQMDSAGYFVIEVLPDDGAIQVLHYNRDGQVNVRLRGRTARALYNTAIENNLLTRLDHAAYLGRELARAEAALRGGEPFVQDAEMETAASQETAESCS